MAYRTILVCFNRLAQAMTLSKLAAVLAKKHEAHVIGLYAVSKFSSYPVTGFPYTGEIYAAYSKRHQEEAIEIEKAFLAAGAGLDKSWEWRFVESEGAPISKIAETHAHCVDLVIMAQPPKDANFLDPDMTFETVLMGSGKPVLIVPEGCDQEHIGEQVLIAWNGTKESARAAFDSLPMLKQAEDGKALLGWIDPPATDGNTKSVFGAELAASLARHDLEVETVAGPKSQSSTGAELLSRASARNADLLVMGAYGHSRIREFAFGGVTDHVLRHAGIPVLMSH